MDPGTNKRPFHCPQCGFVQLEPPHLVSTQCRSCGSFYEVPRPGAKPNTARLGVIALPDPGKDATRDVFCHRCGATHRVSKTAKSTLCTACNAAISLEDVEVDSPVSRAIDTRGNLFVAARGHLSSSWVICRSARVEGRVSGMLRAESELVLASQSALACTISAVRVVVERSHHGEVYPTIETDELVVRGKLEAHVNCRGTIAILRGGRLIGDVSAKALTVDKGGLFSGACRIEPVSRQAHRGDAAPRVLPAGLRPAVIR